MTNNLTITTESRQDYLNNNTGVKYDHRNLIIEFTRQDLNQEPPITDVTRYKYDEAGNRVRKTVYRSNSSNPDPLPEEEEDIPPGWDILKDDYYSREVSGKEIAIYSSYTIQYWNVWSGGEITGRINFTENEARFYYLKDHLGSIRVVLDNSKNVVSANDFDMWGYYLENRSYSTNNTKNKFTGKERDTESSYDYFGARYYDARVGRWLSTDPLFEKHIQFTPYNYVLGNPLVLIDPDGEQIYSIGNDQSADLQDLQKFIGSDAHRLSFDLDDTKKININTEGYTEGENENLDLLIKMNKAFDEQGTQIKFGYEVFSDKLIVDLGGTPYGTKDSPTPYESSSITPRYTDPSMPHGSWPPLGFGGSVKVHIGLLFSFEGNEISRYQFVGHELSEVFERTVNKFDYFKAHRIANEKYFGGEKERPLIMRLSDNKYKINY